METERMLSKKYYIVEHLEEFMYEWSRCEYIQMMKYLRKSSSSLIISNSNIFKNYNNTLDPESNR